MVNVLKLLFQISLVVLIWIYAKPEVYSQRTTPVATGEIAPDFTLQDQNGHKVTLSEARGKNSVVLVFYRGYW